VSKVTRSRPGYGLLVGGHVSSLFSGQEDAYHRSHLIWGVRPILEKGLDGVPVEPPPKAPSVGDDPNLRGWSCYVFRLALI